MLYLFFWSVRLIFSWSANSALKVSKYEVISGPYFPAFGLNTDQKQLRIWTLFTQWRQQRFMMTCRGFVVSNGNYKQISHIVPSLFILYVSSWEDYPLINLLLSNVSILHPLKTPRNLWFSGVLRGYKMGMSARNGLNVRNNG